MRTLFNKTLLTSASILSIFGLLLTVPQSAVAQEMEEDLDSVEMVEEDGEVMSEDMDMDVDVDTDSDFDSDDSDLDTDSDFDSNDSDLDTDADYSAPTYSNSPRALW